MKWFLVALALMVASPVWADDLTPEEAGQHVGQQATVCGPVASAKYVVRSRRGPTFLNLGKPYPRQVFTGVIWRTTRRAFSYPPESLRGKHICITGRIQSYRGKPEIIITSPSQVTVEAPVHQSAPDGRGCCSHHEGVCGCEGGRALCCDGTLSPTCGCD